MAPDARSQPRKCNWLGEQKSFLRVKVRGRGGLPSTRAPGRHIDATRRRPLSAHSYPIYKSNVPSGQQVPYRARNQDLSGSRMAGDPRADVDGDSDYIAADQLTLAGVNAGPHLQPQLFHSL